MQAIRPNKQVPPPHSGAAKVGMIRIYAWIFGRLGLRKVPHRMGARPICGQERVPRSRRSPFVASDAASFVRLFVLVVAIGVQRIVRIKE